MNAYNILPPNRSKLEEGFIYAFDQLIRYDTDIFSALLTPSTTPSETVNVLANDKGLKAWDSNATEQLKREQIKAAWPTRALAGTRKGITEALKGNGFLAEFSVPAPFIVNITAYHEGLSPLTTNSINVLSAQLKEAVNGRDSINMAVGVTATGNEQYAMSVITEIRITVGP